LQPLRVYPGWLIDINGLFETQERTVGDGEPSPVEFFFATNEHRRIAIDVEWRSELREGAGAYLVRVIRAPWRLNARGRRIKAAPIEFDWDNPIQRMEVPTHPELVRELDCLFESAISPDS
jgi:hypothetical protein